MKDKYGYTTEGNYGVHIPPNDLFNNSPRNPFYDMATPYVENILTTLHENPKSNFGAVQIKGGSNNIPDSKIYATRSKGQEFGNDANQDPNSWAGQRFFHSERTGLRALLDEYITSRRQNNALPYNPYLRHSEFNIRRPSSPRPQEYFEKRNPNNHAYKPTENYELNRLKDLSEIEALQNLSSQERMYPPFGNYTYGNVIRKWLNKEGSYINMLSERPACNNPYEIGCTQFLPTTMPNSSNYSYTYNSNRSDDVTNGRKALFSAYNKIKKPHGSFNQRKNPIPFYLTNKQNTHKKFPF